MDGFRGGCSYSVFIHPDSPTDGVVADRLALAIIGMAHSYYLSASAPLVFSISF